ncbi:MAG: TetR/AcrR family transcriptional regulator [Wujia sp.]
MGKAEENKQKKRNALLTHAYTLFTNKGVAATTISEIAANAGVGKGTFYFYFRDKEDLIEKLVAQKAEQVLLHALNDLEKHDKAASVEDKLVFIADDLLTELCKDKMLLKFINKNLTYGFYKKAMNREEIKKDLDIKTEYMKLITADGSNWKDPDLMLFTIVELISGTGQSIILENEPVDLDTYKPYLFECVKKIISVFRID